MQIKSCKCLGRENKRHIVIPSESNRLFSYKVLIRNVFDLRLSFGCYKGLRIQSKIHKWEQLVPNNIQMCVHSISFYSLHFCNVKSSSPSARHVICQYGSSQALEHFNTRKWNVKYYNQRIQAGKAVACVMKHNIHFILTSWQFDAEANESKQMNCTNKRSGFDPARRKT